jgi:hypothetical protein
LDFAQQALQQSQDRFAAGVTNNVEVIQAQQQLASANEQYIATLYAHNIAKVLLARAIGNAESAVRQYLSQPGNVVPSQPAPPNAPNMPTPGAPGTPPNAPAPATPGVMPNSPATTQPGSPSGGAAGTTSGQMIGPGVPDKILAPPSSQDVQQERSSLSSTGHVSEVR